MAASSSTSTRSIIAGAAAACTLGVIGYALYFDYKRRTDIEFRKQLKKQQKKVSTSKAKDLLNDTTATLSNPNLKAALAQVKREPMPVTQEASERYFMEHVGIGEQLASSGPQYYLEAAVEMYKALRVYPVPHELLAIFEKTLPGEVNKLVVQLLSMDVKDKIDGYFDRFPPKDMNVSISTKDVPTEHGTTNVRRVLVAERDFSVGDVIYKESAAVAALDPDLISKGTHCSHCLRKIVPVPGTLLTHPNGTLPTAYCSVECQTSSSQTYYNLLFTREPFVSEMSKETNTPENLKKRISAQEAFAAFLTNTKDQGTQMTHLVAQFTAIYLTAELNRVLGIKFAPPDESSINDHFERLRYVDPDREIIGDAFGLVRGVLDAAVANNIEFLSEERFGILVGKMGYNAVGICYEGGRDDKPKNQEPGIERTRTPYGFERQIGSGIYMTSSYLTHSCAPNTRISFADGTSTLTLIASREIKSGDELTMSYVDVSQKDGETVIDARRRRRKQLALGWKFACRCVRCGDEQPASERDGKERYHDESKEEEVVRRYEQGMAGKGEAMVD